jgi:hypothetical protein
LFATLVTFGLEAAETPLIEAVVEVVGVVDGCVDACVPAVVIFDSIASPFINRFGFGKPEKFARPDQNLIANRTASLDF